MTSTEQELTREHFIDPPEGWTLAVRFHHAGGIHHREVVEQLDGRGNVTRPAQRAGEAHE